MKRYLIFTLTELVMLSTPLLAQNAVSPAVDNALARAVAQYQQEQTPLDVFKQQLQAIKNPHAEILLQALETLVSYNELFKSTSDEAALRKLAAQLEGPHAVPWNTYRGNGLKEIFDNYIPKHHHHQQIADLEYYVKRHTLSYQFIEQNHLVQKALPDFFQNAYAQLEKQLQDKNCTDNQALWSLILFGEQYAQLQQQDPIVAKAVKSSLFRMPIKAGWDRTTTIRALTLELGTVPNSEGYTLLSVPTLQRKYHLTEPDAQQFAQFVQAVRY